MEGGPHTEQYETAPEPVPNFVELYGNQVMTFYGVTDTLANLTKLCPVPLEDVPLETMNTYAVNIMNESDVEIRAEDAGHMREILDTQGRDFKLIVAEPEVGSEPTPDRYIESKSESVATSQVEQETAKHLTEIPQQPVAIKSETVETVNFDGRADIEANSHIIETGQQPEPEYAVIGTQSGSDIESQAPVEVSAAGYSEWLDEQSAKRFEQFEALAYESESSVNDEGQEYTVPLAEQFEDDAVHTAVEMLVSEAEDASVTGMDEEQLSAALQALFGDSGFLVVDTDEITGESESLKTPPDVSETFDVLVERFEVEAESGDVLELDIGYEEFVQELLDENVVIVKDFDEDGNEILFLVEAQAIESEVEESVHDEARVIPMAQVIEERIHETMVNEPERFAALPETEQPVVLYEEMIQITKAIHELAIEQKTFGANNEETIALYEQRLAVVVEKLMTTLDPEFDPVNIAAIIEKLLAGEAKLYWQDDDRSVSSRSTWGLSLGQLALLRSELVLAA